MKEVFSIQVANKDQLIAALLELSKGYKNTSLLNSNSYHDKYGKYELLFAMGNQDRLPFKALQKREVHQKKWLFLHLSYDFKNKIENLGSEKPDRIQFPDFSAFIPDVVFCLRKNTDQLHVVSSLHSATLEKKFKKILQSPATKAAGAFPKLSARMDKREYLERIKKLQEHIQLGNIYEANFCMEFFAENIHVNAEEMYLLLNKRSPSPFSAFYKTDEKYLLCASPERFLAKRKNKLISQPIKGTAKRGTTADEDAQMKRNLLNDLKEQTENVMIVDVVRNDLSRIAERGSVNVEELFGIYSFPQVHQMISTVICSISEKRNFMDCIHATFPMASMTGAPKISAMKILEKMEANSRGLYSGSVGYISPDGDFDLNVVIRSFLYDKNSQYLSYSTGGAITAMSDPEQEYAECLLKAKAIFE